MKKILAMAAVAALAAGASAYAANPFSDVSTSDWAYQAISDLSDRGLIEGYPDGSFRGEQNITRYELAQIVARLMAKEDQMNAEDRAIIDRLASEYAGELENLGVRVSNLEKKVGNIAWSGDARIRYQKNNTSVGKEDSFEGRIRINARATVNDTTYVHGRFSAEADLKESTDAAVKMDRIYVHHQFGKIGATLGRYELNMGQQLGGWLYSNAFDGIELSAPLGDKVNLAIGYGRMKDARGGFIFSSDGDSGSPENRTKYTVESDIKKAEIFYAQLKADLKVVKLGIDYFRSSPFDYRRYEGGGIGIPGTGTAQDATWTEKGRKSVWGVNLLVPVKDFRVFGDYYADTKENPMYGNNKGKIWTVGIGYGKHNTQNPGSFALDIAYFKVKGGIYEGGMTNSDALSLDHLLRENGRFWLASGDVTLAKNIYLHGEYAFASKSEIKRSAEEYGNSWALSLNYLF